MHGEESIGGSRVDQPAFQDRDLLRTKIFVKAHTHAKPRTYINDATRQLQFFAFMFQEDLHAGLGLHGVQGVNVTTGAADIAGASSEVSTGGDLGDVRYGDNWSARRGALILHGGWNSSISRLLLAPWGHHRKNATLVAV